MQTTLPSLNSLQIIKNKPTLICDADEVIFDFMNELITFLKSHKLFFKWDSYALTGNIVRKDRTALNENEVKKLLNSFFKNCTKNMQLINGAKSSLNRLQKKSRKYI